MKYLLEDADLADKVEVDSAGTYGYHTGELPDSRMRKAASQRDIKLTHLAREITPADLDEFDLVLVMDHDNYQNVKTLDRDQQYHDKIRLFCEYCTEHDNEVVPDPYYGGADGFELVLDLLEDGCAELVKRLQEGQPLIDNTRA